MVSNSCTLFRLDRNIFQFSIRIRYNKADALVHSVFDNVTDDTHYKLITKLIMI